VKRRLFNALAGLSLVLCLATATLWIRSYRTADRLWLFARDGDWIQLRADTGVIELQIIRARTPRSPREPLVESYFYSHPPAGIILSHEFHGAYTPDQKTWVRGNFAVACKIERIPLSDRERAIQQVMLNAYLARQEMLFSIKFYDNPQIRTRIEHERRDSEFNIEYLQGLLYPVRPGAMWTLLLPARLLASLFMILPAIQLFLRIKTRRLPPGLCSNCGYDLRATPTRCPECGAIPSHQQISPPKIL
jgi:hypothetical protein